MGNIVSIEIHNKLPQLLTYIPEEDFMLSDKISNKDSISNTV